MEFWVVTPLSKHTAPHTSIPFVTDATHFESNASKDDERRHL
jgi:hypothetical protein